jgi:MurNAc alpha-1-phosphate uridylyltransferase
MTGTRAMMLAAGLGTRMRPLTLTRPKPLIEVAGRSLIDRGVDALEHANVELVVVNKHYLAGQIEDWAAARTTPHIIVQDEEALILDTGGGVAKALPHLGPEPFFVLNSDSFWVDGPQPALQRMRQAWNDATMDCCFCLPARTALPGLTAPGISTWMPQGGLRAGLAKRRSMSMPGPTWSTPGCSGMHPKVRFP